MEEIVSGKKDSIMPIDDILNPRILKKAPPLTEKLASKGYKYNDVASKPKSYFTKKRKHRKKRK